MFFGLSPSVLVLFCAWTTIALYFFLLCYFRFRRQRFLFDIAIIDHCMYVDSSWGIKIKFV